ncbi:uncharacterized protein [Spinacia oleracea]|uniref:Retrotransposon Copia-like N-terminal domain-containing protein n=1 Tax=Spinacia oleracea TaxID=3562 RepID=A0A9R0J491_SPIOL|nr:uncharacterized protein LOC110798837 [Spinacia oleracea]
MMPADQQEPSQNPNSAYYLRNNDLNSTKLVSIEFEGKCFSDWRRSMMIALSARNKLCFVDGSLNQPAPNAANYRIWIRCNDLVISWMLASLEPKIARSVLYLKTAREIWLELEDRYCRESGPQLFSVQQQLSELTQGDDEEVASFFTKIKMLWDQLDGLDPLPVCIFTGCSCTLTQQLLKTQQKQRLIQFLMKLNDKRFDNKPYKCSYNNSPTSQYAGTGSQYKNFTSRNNLYCEHCKMRNHTVDKCWKLHGYPKDFKGKGKRIAATAQLDEYTPKETKTDEGSGVVHATFTED